MAMRAVTTIAAVLLALAASASALPSVWVDHASVSRTRVYENVLPPELYERMASDARAIAQYESGYTLKDNKKRTRWFPAGATPKTALEEAIVRLRTIVKPEGPGATEQIAGCEWWVQLVDATEPIGFHLDKDESVASNKHYLLHPVYGTILYLSDVGGPTLIIDQYSPNGNGYIPEVPESAELVYPKPNKFAIFKGHLLHGVVAGEAVGKNDPPNARRLTFLMNWWTVKPEAPNCELLDHAHVQGLRVYDAAEMAAWRATFDAAHRPKRSPLSTAELYRGGSTPARDYAFRLPGGAETSVRLPKHPERGNSYTLRWTPGAAAKDKAKAKAAAAAAAAKAKPAKLAATAGAYSAKPEL